METGAPRGDILADQEARSRCDDPDGITQRHSRLQWLTATLAELAQRFDVHPNQITDWRKQLVANAAEVFGADGESRPPAIDVKALHAKIRQQALELDFLANALGRGSGPTGKR